MRKIVELAWDAIKPAGLVMLAAGLLAGGSLGQDLPNALKRNAELSPRNINDYNAAIDRYRRFACVEKAEQTDPGKGGAGNTSVGKTDSCRIQEVEAVRARDQLILATVGQIDLNYMKYRRSSRRSRVLFETLADFLTLGADFAAVIVNGVRPKTIISAASGFAQLSRDSAAKNLKLQEAQILFNKMDAKRAGVLRTILINIRGDPSEDIPRKGLAAYPFELAWLDVIAYYNAGTFDEALADLSADTANEKQEQEDEILKLKGVKPTPISSIEDRDAAVAASDFLTDLFLKLGSDNAALNKLTAIAVSIEQEPKLGEKLAAAGGASTGTDGKEIYRAIVKLMRDAKDLKAEQTVRFINRAILSNR